MSRRDRDFDERSYVDVRVRDREQERDRDPLARYFQEDRRGEAGALVIRHDVETYDRPRPRARSPSPANYRYTHSVSPMPPREREVERVEIRDRVVDRELPRQFREPSRERVSARIVSRGRERSLTPSPDREREREREIRITSRRPSPSLSPSPPPAASRPVIRGPVLERDVITHYTDVDHGVVYAPPVPVSPVRERERERDRETEININSSRRRTEVDIHESTSRERRRSVSRVRRPAPARASDLDVVVRDRTRLDIDIDGSRDRRSHSAQPARSRYDSVGEEARYIESRIDDRGEMGEARHGATRDWTIVDVPPGTERVRMDGVGGGGADVTWQRYNGVRRTRFIPDRDDESDLAPRRKGRQAVPERERGSHDRINVQITDHDAKYSSREYVPTGRNDMWTEITRDLVSREAMDQLGYEYNETEYFYYILEYLHNEDVQELVQLSDRIRRHRRKQRHSRDEVDVDVDIDLRPRHRSHSHSHSRHRPRREDDRVYEREVLVDRHLRPTYYY